MRRALAIATWCCSAVLATVAAVAVAQAQGGGPDPAASAASPPPSDAERLLFMLDHLANTRRPGSLRYLYVEDAPGKARVSAPAVLTLSAGAGGRCCDVHGDYLSGAMAVNLPDIPDAHANPVLLYFLEGEVRHLQQATTGQAAHFRRRIRQSLVDSATVSEGTIRWGARSVPARTVRVAPFLTDPFRNRFMEQSGTEYAFVFSDAVPGGVYEMRATVPGTPAGAAPLARRTLTLEESKP